jgi:hypothetical protein
MKKAWLLAAFWLGAGEGTLAAMAADRPVEKVGAFIRIRGR